ncbi:uncharacterized protein LOC110883875 isoform X1 [Helianthus annuus]|uniref:uncharacterized protein LOC110883875 isoform X1 n=1 Tax=Helianthus annuus TaxID=4232 RepID=UPI000B8F6696|nr:uncharacterized protein LOC110883875 isoform X1 [Helianthus annuus]XP_021987223.1 uncharacterized protein LOC110883875 isoform X1 [Helianthus annuus]XP_021987225.1 uncharacterized protein LOC110883875 isoform X1 [Helianthus annuus]
MKGNGDLDAKGINGQSHEEKRLGEVSRATLGHDQDVQLQAQRVLMDTKVKEMKDQLIRAKAYLSFAAIKPKQRIHETKMLKSQQLSVNFVPSSSATSFTSMAKQVIVLTLQYQPS